MKEERNENIKYQDVLRFAWHYWSRRLGLAGIALGMMIGATLVDIFIPVYMGKIVDALTFDGIDRAEAASAALLYLGISVALSVLFTLLRWGSHSMWAIFAMHNLGDIVTEAMQKVQRFSSDWHANSFAGGTVRKITRGMWSFDLFEDTLFINLMPSFMIMFGMSAMLLWKLPLVGLFTIAMIVIYCAISIWMSVAILAPLFRRSAASDTKIGACLADTITGNATVKAFGSESREDVLFQGVVAEWKMRCRKAWLTGEFGNTVRGILRMVLMTGMIGLTVWLWREGRASAGDIAVALTSFFIVAGYMRDVGMYIAHLQKSISEMEDIVSFWAQDLQVCDVAKARPLIIGANGSGRGEIVFDDVCFSYDNQDQPVYEGLNVQVAPGEKVALVGPSGSGKSTFVKLVQRLYDLDSGAILIDGQNIAEVTQDSLRQNIALVPQEPILFHRSLAENLAYGRPDAGMGEIIAAAHQAYADDFIRDLSMGYDTLVGERGVKLSGGERQRVAIARAILADAPILILDEATSALDSVSEHYIQKALKELMIGRTTITVAHRLATIREADRILVFDKGRIVEQGTHDELVEQRRSVYRKLYEMQALDLVGAKN